MHDPPHRKPKHLPPMQRPRFDPWVGKIPWRRKWQLTPVFLPGEFHGQKGLAGYSPWGRKESDTTTKQTVSTIVLVSGIQRSDSVFLQIIHHLKFLQDNGYNSQCIFLLIYRIYSSLCLFISMSLISELLYPTA